MLNSFYELENLAIFFDPLWLLLFTSLHFFKSNSQLLEAN